MASCCPTMPLSSPMMDPLSMMMPFASMYPTADMMMPPSTMPTMSMGTWPLGNCPALPMTSLPPAMSSPGSDSPFYQTERNRHMTMWNLRNWISWMNKEVNCGLLKAPGRPANWEEYYSLHNPIKIDNYGQRVFCVTFDMSSYRPEEVKVGVRNERIVIEAGFEYRFEGTEEGTGKSELVGTVPPSCPSLLTKPSVVKCSFYREIPLPDDCRITNIRAFINPEGLLVVSCPLPGIPICPVTYIAGYPPTASVSLPRPIPSSTSATGVPSGLPPMTSALLASKMSGGDYGYDKMMMTPPTPFDYSTNNMSGFGTVPVAVKSA